MFISEEKLQELAYELYKIDWEGTHISNARKLKTYLAYQVEKDTSYDENYTFDDYLFDNGYGGGEIYACFEEFLECEYQDEEYMEYLLGGSVFWKAYEKYQGA